MCEDTNATLGNFDSWMWKDWSAKAANIPAEKRGFSNSVLWLWKSSQLGPSRNLIAVYLHIEMNWFVKACVPTREQSYIRVAFLFWSQDTVFISLTLSCFDVKIRNVNNNPWKIIILSWIIQCTRLDEKIYWFLMLNPSEEIERVRRVLF